MDWPLFDLRIVNGPIHLRAVTDNDLPTLVDLMPDDLEIDPEAERFAGLGDGADRHRHLVSQIWKHRGTWSPSSWCLDLAVELDGRVVGVQALEGDSFARLRTVDSYSWLGTSARGRGLATAMRAGILGLAFDHLGAEFAVSSAVLDNAPSLAVSRRLGYVDNGLSLINTPSGPDTLRHFRLTRAAWAAGSHAVRCSGVEACLPWFGLA